VAAGAAVASGGALTFAATGASRRWRGAAPATGWLGPLAAPGMRTVFAALASLGAAIGIVQVAVPAFTAAEGSAEAIVLLAVGVILAPTTIVGSALLDVVAPAGTVTEAFTVMIMGVVAGNAAGNAAGGALVDGASYEAAALAAAAAASCGAAWVVVRRRTLAPANVNRAG
jgi:hypothetical protein